MKRPIVCLVAFSLLVVLGMFAIAQAQKLIVEDGGDTSVVVSRFTDSAADRDDQTASDDGPTDPLQHRVLGVDPRVHVMRDDQAEPVYRGQPRAGVVLAAHDDAIDSRGAGQAVTVVAGDNAGDASATVSSGDVPRSLAAAPAERDYGDAARKYAADDEVPDAKSGSAVADRPHSYANSSRVAQDSTAGADAQPESSQLSSVRDATDAIDAEVAATRRGNGDAPAAQPEISASREAIPKAAPMQPSTAQTPQSRPADVPTTHIGDPAAGAVGTGTPGSRDLEGAQSPSLTIEKVVPGEVQVGKTAQFEIRVQNTGRSVARELQVVDQVPQGARLVNTEPRADLGDRGELIWNLAALEPGATAIVRVELAPMVEGQIGSVARVRFSADASARTTVTKPQITVDVVAPEQVMIGEEAMLAITVSNPGSGEATGVILEADIPANLKHPAGTELEFEVGSLRPNESRRLELTVTAAKQGPASPTLIARAAGVPAAEKSLQMEVVAPKLQVGVEGPKRRFLDRKSTHVVTVSNPGTAAATDIELVAYLPRGMKFVEANNHGTYDASQHAVYWSLAELPPQRSGDVQLVTMPTESGEQLLRVEGKATRGLADQCEETISVEGVAALSFQISDLADPLAVGGQASYEVRVVNTGSKSASNVQVVAILPTEMAATDAKGPTASKLVDGKIVFQPIVRLAPKEEQVFQFRAEATKAGDLRVRVQLTSDEIQQPITQEESTRVFADQ